MPLDMDIVNAALVRQRSEQDAVSANAANAALRKKTELGQEDFMTLDEVAGHGDKRFRAVGVHFMRRIVH